jgi:hypothetical protein
VVLGLAGCGSSASPRRANPDATPAEVVRQFILAEIRGDRGVVQGLSTPPHWRELVGEADNLLNNPTRVSKLVVSTGLRLDRRRRLIPPGLMHAQVVYVTVSYIGHQARVLTRPNGRQAWAYFLVRDRSSQPWRVGEEGFV